MDGMPGFVSRGRALSIIDWLVNAKRAQVASDLGAANADVVKLLTKYKNAAQPGEPSPTDEDIEHVKDDWLGKQWWSASQYPTLPDTSTRNDILVGAYRKAIELAAARTAACANPPPGFEVCVESYWICHGRAFEAYVLDHPRVVTLILMTPPPPPDEFPLTVDEDIHAVATQKRIRQLEGKSGGSDTQVDSTRLKTHAALAPRFDGGCCK